jgi:hypothetical protein
MDVDSQKEELAAAAIDDKLHELDSMMEIELRRSLAPSASTLGHFLSLFKAYAEQTQIHRVAVRRRIQMLESWRVAAIGISPE